MRNTLILALIALLLLALTACGTLSDEQRIALTEWARQQFTSGQITEAQYNAILNALEGGSEWWMSTIEVVTAIAKPRRRTNQLLTAGSVEWANPAL